MSELRIEPLVLQPTEKLTRAMKIATSSGKVIFGSKRAIKAVKKGTAALVILANNCPDEIKKDILYYSAISNINLVILDVNSIDMGRILGKPFFVASMTIQDPGDSEILKLTEG